jgi:benzodiazapine receptor
MSTIPATTSSDGRGVVVGKFLICFALVAGAAFFGTQFGPGRWYQALDRPPLAPPNWIFGPVWSVLYLIMAITAGWVWSRPHPGRNTAFGWFCGQLVLNGLWSWIFFGLQQPALALVDIVMLWFAIWQTIRAYAVVSPPAAYWMYPYWAWVSFATYLNAGFWLANR